MNDVEIYEGYIIKIVSNGVTHNYVVGFDEEELDFKATNGKKEYSKNFEYLGCCDEVLVIGNIFENNNLLGKEY